MFRKSESGYVFIDEFTSLFGGNGIEFSVSDPLESANGELLFRLEWTEYCRGYYSIPGDGSSYVSPLELSLSQILSTDGKNLYTEYDHR
ncbi:MAG: hypothetical protein KAR40_01780 [Candidatus Sabulitectum sp.]|nr:hypothetical protein [Candidatus Sabulitectum sp.]